jgi:hypothetical protein
VPQQSQDFLKDASLRQAGRDDIATEANMADQGPSKRRRVGYASKSRSSTPFTSLNRDISPPPRANSESVALKVESDDATEGIKLSQPAIRIPTAIIKQEHLETVGNSQRTKDESTDPDTEDNDMNEVAHPSLKGEEVASKSTPPPVRVLPSPIQLTRIRDLPSSNNVDTIGLRDLIGDPMIKECWQFNFLLDLDFIM